jgi:hypothetical protein
VPSGTYHLYITPNLDKNYVPIIIWGGGKVKSQDLRMFVYSEILL